MELPVEGVKLLTRYDNGASTLGFYTRDITPEGLNLVIQRMLDRPGVVSVSVHSLRDSTQLLTRVAGRSEILAR